MGTLDLFNSLNNRFFTSTTYTGVDWDIDKSRNYFTWKYNDETKKYGSKIVIPGVTKEQLSIQQEDEVITLEVTEETNFYSKGKKWYMAVPYNAKMKTFSATLADGVLTLEVDREVKVREFEIN